jgi:ketosteroid isomerase-like protein
MLKSSLATIAAAVVLMAGCTKQPDAPNAITEATQVINQFPAAFESGNIDILSQILSHDSILVVFGTDSAEYWVGYPAVEQALKAQLASFTDINFTVTHQKINVSENLDAAWFSEMADWSMTANGQPVELKGIRITGVLDKEPDVWKIVQMHFSLPVSGQAAEY